MTRRRAVHANNVYHYRHVLAAMRESDYDVTLMRRHEFTDEQAARVARFPATGTVVKMIQRRVSSPLPGDVTTRSLGPLQLVYPMATRVPRMPLVPEAFRAATHDSARRVARVAQGAELLHFVDGFGHQSLRHRATDVAVMERRNLHHEVFEADIEVYGGFPFAPKREPLRDFLEEEYALADRILVYSEVVRESFVVRGYDPAKICTVPLPVTTTTAGTRRPDEFRLLYVGRGNVYKGLDVAVEATRRLGEPFRLVVAGPMSAQAHQWIQKLDWVEPVGICSREELRDLYLTSRCLLLPSLESYGLVAFEAASAGLPVLCRETTGACEYLPTETHTVIHGRDPDDWAAGILAVGEWPADTRTVSQELLSVPEHDIVGRLSDLYGALRTCGSRR